MSLFSPSHLGGSSDSEGRAFLPEQSRARSNPDCPSPRLGSTLPRESEMPKSFQNASLIPLRGALRIQNGAFQRRRGIIRQRVTWNNRTDGCLIAAGQCGGEDIDRAGL